MKIPFPHKPGETPIPATLTLGDVAQFIHSPAQAARAYHELMRLKHDELVDVYLPAGWVAAGHRRFNVWLGHQVAPPQGERVTLEEWCARWLAAQHSPEGPGDAA